MARETAPNLEPIVEAARAAGKLYTGPIRTQCLAHNLLKYHKIEAARNLASDLHEPPAY